VNDTALDTDEAREIAFAPLFEFLLISKLMPKLRMSRFVDPIERDSPSHKEKHARRSASAAHQLDVPALPGGRLERFGNAYTGRLS
jgi:hypothetical protein